MDAGAGNETLIVWALGGGGAVIAALVVKLLYDKWTEGDRNRNGYVGKPVYEMAQAHQAEAAKQLLEDFRELIARYDRDQDLRREEGTAFTQRMDIFREELRRIVDRLDLMADRIKDIERILKEQRVAQAAFGTGSEK